MCSPVFHVRADPFGRSLLILLMVSTDFAFLFVLMYLGRCGPASTRGAVTQMSDRDASLFMLWGELWFQNAPGLKVRFIEPAPPLISFLFILSGESLKRHGAVCLVTVEHGQVCGCQCDMTHTAEHDAPSRTVVFGCCKITAKSFGLVRSVPFLRVLLLVPPIRLSKVPFLYLLLLWRPSAREKGKGLGIKLRDEKRDCLSNLRFADDLLIMAISLYSSTK